MRRNMGQTREHRRSIHAVWVSTRPLLIRGAGGDRVHLFVCCGQVEQKWVRSRNFRSTRQTGRRDAIACAWQEPKRAGRGCQRHRRSVSRPHGDLTLLVNRLQRSSGESDEPMPKRTKQRCLAHLNQRAGAKWHLAGARRMVSWSGKARLDDDLCHGESYAMG